MREAGIRSAMIATALAIIPAGCGFTDPEESRPEQILFIGGASSAEDIYRINADGSGLVNLTRYVATYWAEKNVRCNLISFGGVKTGSFDKEFVDNFLERVPMRRQAEKGEYNGVIQFLASDASSY